MLELQEIFDINYGHSLELNKLEPNNEGVNFVSRTAKNNGVSAKVSIVQGYEPVPKGAITVSLGGSVLEAFLQNYPFYTGYHIYYLTPKEPMSDLVKLFYCTCIRANKYRYSYGRQANRTLRSLLVPSLNEVPSWINEYDVDLFLGAEKALEPDFKTTFEIENWKEFTYSELFDIKKGLRLTKANMLSGEIPFIGSTDSNNGLTTRVGQDPIHEGNVITINYNGSVGESFYQPLPFWASDDVNVLYPRKDKFPHFNAYIALFIIPFLKMEQYRFNYGRKWHTERMNQSVIKLPVDQTGALDLDMMESYIKSLPFSSSVELSK